MSESDGLTGLFTHRSRLCKRWAVSWARYGVWFDGPLRRVTQDTRSYPPERRMVSLLAAFFVFFTTAAMAGFITGGCFFCGHGTAFI